MKLLRILLFSLLVILLSSFYVFGAGPVCCYDPSSPTLIPSATSCLSNQIQVGPVDADGTCNSYLSTQLGCLDTAGSCSETANGNYLFNLSSLNTINTAYKSTYCPGGFADFSTDPRCTSTGSSGSVGQSGSSSNSNSNSGTPVSITPNSSISSSTNSGQNLLNGCSNEAGGSFGFFETKASCEASVDASLHHCLWNPNLGGELSTYSGFNYVNVWNQSPLEDSCISKALIQSCFDYKTQENCNGNLANISDSCHWIPSSSYAGNSLSKQTGICISNATATGKDYNKAYFGDRGNLIQNPSFENASSWTSLSSSDLIYSQNSFNGNFYYSLDSNGISQKITNLPVGKQFTPSLYLQYNSSISSGVDLQIIPYDSNSNQMTSFNQTISMSQLRGTNGIFQKITFNNFIIQNGTSYIIFKIKSSGTQNVNVDAVSFILDNKLSSVNTLQIFDPISIISSSASNCNLCFDNENLNSCTKAKSDLLGDCEYMVSGPGQAYEASNLSNYYGKSVNPYIYKKGQSSPDTNNLIWKSQSLSKSSVFCGLYLTKSQCLDPNNFANKEFKSLNPDSGSTLCKWENNYGCFKDSNNDNKPDTYTNSLGFNIPDVSRYQSFANYPISFNSSDFEKGCDMLPPNSYIYFTGKNLTGGNVIVTNLYNKTIGNLKMHLKMSDISLESCSPFNFNRSLYLDVGINSKYFLIKYPSSQVNETFSLNSLLNGVTNYYNAQGKLITVTNFKNQFFNSTGNNILSFRTIDQSGNLGKEFNFSFTKLDSSPPNINLTDYTQGRIGDFIHPQSSFGKNTILNYSIKDMTAFNCSYKLSPYNNEYVSPSNYIGSGFFNSSSLNNSVFNYNLSQNINKTSPNGNIFSLNISCSDQFGQTSSSKTIFSVDFDTSVVPISPSRYLGNYSSPTGYINSATPFVAVSSANDLASCNLIDFKNLNNNGALDIKSVPLGFKLNSYPGVTFYNNVTGTLDFNTQGVQNGAIKCVDNLGNVYVKNLSYDYDNIAPVLKSFSLVKSDNVYFDGKNYYTIPSNSIGYANEVNLNLSFSGTGSRVDSIKNLSGWNKTSIWSNLRDIPITISSNSTYDPNSDRSNLIISDFDNQLLYEGIPQSEKNLYLKKFSFSFSDLANNSNNATVKYYFDSSKPVLSFGGDIANQDSSHIYTSSSNPTINLSFNTPSYRKYSCRVIGEDNGKFSQFAFDNISSNLVFNLKKIFGYDVNIKSDNVSLNFNCSDVYGKKLSGKYQIVFDDTAPILNDITFDNGANKIFMVKSLNKVFPDIKDKLIFNLANTNEISYRCYYNFVPADNEFYFCNQSNLENTFYSSGMDNTNSLVLLAGTNGNNKSICYRARSFDGALKNLSLDVNSSLDTKITLTGYCVDRAGLKSKTITKDLHIIYSPNDFISFGFKYKDKKAYAVVKSFVDYSSIRISADRLAQSGVYETLSNPIVVNGSEQKVYEYVAQNGFSLDNFQNGQTMLYAISPDGQSYISSNLIVDKVNPTVKLDIPDEVNNKVYTKDFWVNLNAQDNLPGSLSKVQLFLNGLTIFSYDGKNYTYDHSKVGLDLGSGIAFTNKNSEFDGHIELKNLTYGLNYTLTLQAYDEVNNMNETSNYFNLKNGVGILLSNSKNAKVDPSRSFWITSNVAPTIHFNTTKLVSQCSIDAMNNNAWIQKGIPIAKPVVISNGGNLLDSFSLNLSTLPGFNLSLLDSKSDLINISCLDANNTKYDYVREIKYINSVPDYVLTSSNGFVLNEKPYTTSIDVKSVGPYRYVNCKYNDGQSGFKNFTGKNALSFHANLDYSYFKTGVYNLSVQCTDLLGNVGPVKVYPISINKNANLLLTNLSIINPDGYHSKPVSVGDASYIYVNSMKDLSLQFTLNKKNNVDCSYNLNSGSLFGFVFAIKNLFSIGVQKITTTENPFVYSFDNFNLGSSSEVLNVKCSIQGSNQQISKSYNVKLLGAPVSVLNWI